MKSLIVMTVLALSMSSAKASEVYQCQALIPRGAIQLTVDYAQGIPSKIVFNFKDYYSQQTLAGDLFVKQFEVNSGSYDATGVLLEGKEEITVSLSGSIKPDPTTGRYGFSLSGRTKKNWPNLIDFGYGNRGQCTRVE